LPSNASGTQIPDFCQATSSYTLEAFAALIAAEGEPERAVRLYGGAEALRETIGIPLRPRYRPRYECEVEAARGKLDEERFRAAWAEGRAMSMEEAIAYFYNPTQGGRGKGIPMGNCTGAASAWR
jgi:hypothetical protein